MPNERSSDDQGVWALALTLQVLGLAADPVQIVHDAGVVGPLSETDLLRAAKRFPVKAKAVSSTIPKLANTPFPALAMMRDGRVMVVGKVADSGVFGQSLGDDRPLIHPWNEFEANWTGHLILVARRAQIQDLYRRFDLT